uniref:LytR/AlgR family response regulator transcription factor n=1 Tax=Polaribacter sp. TaxID=1920175 RepID=UPI0040483E86
MIKAILIDDEQDAIESLAWEIKMFCKDIKIIDSFTDPEEAISAINYLKPDCVFLDIEMPRIDGFQLLSNLNYRDFDLVITTAYDNYALKAFKEALKKMQKYGKYAALTALG